MRLKLVIYIKRELDVLFYLILVNYQRNNQHFSFAV
jgi:hypothetical protein